VDAFNADAVCLLSQILESLIDNSRVLVRVLDVPVNFLEVSQNCDVDLVVQVILAHKVDGFSDEVS
jgi:hypothetical protein